MLPYPIQSFTSVVLFALVHLYANKTRFINKNLQGQFLSFGSGVALAYIFIDLLPKLSRNENLVKGSLENLFPYFEHHVYIMALLGFLLFFIVDRSQNLLNKQSAYFTLSLGSYALFNFLIGYAVVDKDNPEVQPLLLFTFAIGLHYFMNDYSLTQAHGSQYDRFGNGY